MSHPDRTRRKAPKKIEASAAVTHECARPTQSHSHVFRGGRMVCVPYVFKLGSNTQHWEVGQIVKVGFLKLTVQAAVLTPNDGLPDLYFLTNLAGDRLYQFVPYHGLTRVSAAEAAETMAQFRAECERTASAAIAKAAQQAQIRATFAKLFEREAA